MKKVLVINSSAKAVNSTSRKLTEIFVEHLKSRHANTIINFRELGNADVPHINEKWINAVFKPQLTRSADEAAVLKMSDTYIAELRVADIIVIGTPMYNWSIPSTLKAYIDQIMRLNETFKLNPGNMLQPYIGLLENKTLFLLLSRGNNGYEKGEHNEHLNFQSSYLKTIFNMIGISDIHMIAINGASLDKEQFKTATAMAHQTIADLIAGELV